MSQPIAVRAENLWKRFGYRRALCGVDLEIHTGSCLAIFGHNGAGKSTLLNILSTRTRPTSGKLNIFGHELQRSVLEARRSIGVVFHESCLRNDLTLDENLRFYAGLYGLRKLSRKTEDMIQLLGLENRRGDPVRTFSQGMRKRTTLIRSLLHDPGLWLLDEPFSGLDPEGQQQLEDMIKMECDGGRTVVFVTHHPDRGLRLADDAVVLRDGEIAIRGCENIQLDLLKRE